MSVFQPEIKALLQRFAQDPNSLNQQELDILRGCRMMEGNQLTPRGRDIAGKWET